MLQEKLVDYVQDAHAMEKNVEAMLRSMISASDDPEMRQRLEEHLEETKEHQARLEERLDALDAGESVRKQTQAVAPAILKGVVDQVQGDKAGKNARDAYVTEHLEIAAYELLERLADRAGDSVTAEVARLNLSDEHRMSEFIESRWDDVIELTLAEAA